MKNWIHIFLWLILFSGCVADGEPDLKSEDIPLVVEGWIEDGNSPLVMVTHAVDLTDNAPSFDNFVERWCRVSIYDGNERYLLTARMNEAYITSLVFTNSRLKGKAGHSYRLVVESDDRTVCANVAMPPKAPRITLVPEKIKGDDSSYRLRAYIDDTETSRYLKFFIKVIPEDVRYYPSFLGTVDTQSGTAKEGVILTKGKRAEINPEDASSFSHYFKSGDRVMVKCCSLDEAMYDFWRIYDANVSLSENMFFSYGANLPTNIDNGLGYFAAYSITEAVTTIP